VKFAGIRILKLVCFRSSCFCQRAKVYTVDSYGA